MATADLPEYWDRTQAWYSYADNVRGKSHVLATVVEKPFEAQLSGLTLKGVPAAMGADHPVAWCKDYQGGRSFYTDGATSALTGTSGFGRHVAGALEWTAGVADSVYSDCGATVWANFEQVKISGPPNLKEPIGFDQLPDGRVIQTARSGQVRMHDPATGVSSVIATLPVYTNSEDGLYGPAVDPDFATNRWVYLFYPPNEVTVTQSDGVTRTITTPGRGGPRHAGPRPPRGTRGSATSSCPASGSSTGPTPSLDLASEQKIMQVAIQPGRLLPRRR